MSIIYEEQEKELEKLELCQEILRNSRNQLYLSMRFLDVAFSSLAFVPEASYAPFGTDGFCFYYHPDSVLRMYQNNRVYVNRGYLHSILHCLFCHLGKSKDKEKLYWDLACDIAVESILDGLYQKCVYRPIRPYRRNCYRRFEETLPVLTAEGIYRELLKHPQNETELEQMCREFYRDDHQAWDQEMPGPREQERNQHWEDIREKMETEMETFSKEAADDAKSLIQQIRVENRPRYDYREFLRKFAVLKEEMKVDMDSFDYIFYNYGMEVYGNMPLIEPQETKEEHRIEDFVIVIDTSMSCKGELVKRFLEETYAVLSQSESFFRKIHIHLIQCDDQIQGDCLITSGEQLKAYMEQFTIRGEGGTDFRPAFAYVNELVQKRAFGKLKGLIYFTDGYGIFPVKKPVYETAFVFLEEDYRDVDVPPWAIKLILSSEDILGGEHRHEY